MSHVVTNMHTWNHKNRPSVLVDPLTYRQVNGEIEGARAEGMLIKDQSKKEGEYVYVCVYVYVLATQKCTYYSQSEDVGGK